MVLTGLDQMSSLYRGPFIDASYQVLVQFARQFFKRFLEIDQPETSIAWGDHVCEQIGTKLAIFRENIPTKFRFIWPSGFRES